MTPEAPHTSPLTEAERRELLRLARAAVRAAVHGGDPALVPVAPTPALLAPGGAFVTLRREEELRGCIGTVWPRDPLFSAVVRMARASALEDPRFAPLSAAELFGIVIEISRLSIPRLAAVDAVDVSRHGLYIIRGPARGLLLPQVPQRFGWSREQFLAETCIKAGLDAAAWQDPTTRVYVFEAESFAETDALPSASGA